jgi:hypothetical protein
MQVRGLSPGPFAAARKPGGRGTCGCDDRVSVRAFTCPDCRRLVVVESLECLHSSTVLGFDWRAREMSPLGEGVACANRSLAWCNGLAGPSGYLRQLCADANPSGGRRRGRSPAFSKAETAKRRLIFELLELGLPVAGYRERRGGLAFDMLNSRWDEVQTGHDDGVITLDLAEADDAHREHLRTQLGEPYRTLLGHLRHEIAHYYEPILCPENPAASDRYRNCSATNVRTTRRPLPRTTNTGLPRAGPRDSCRPTRRHIRSRTGPRRSRIAHEVLPVADGRAADLAPGCRTGQCPSVKHCWRP